LNSFQRTTEDRSSLRSERFGLKQTTAALVRAYKGRNPALTMVEELRCITRRRRRRRCQPDAPVLAIARMTEAARRVAESLAESAAAGNDPGTKIDSGIRFEFAPEASATISPRHGGPPIQDVQRAVFAALDRGVALPAALLPIAAGAVSASWPTAPVPERKFGRLGA
jgi:hypothetical protein